MKVTFRKGGGEIRVKKRLLTPFTFLASLALKIGDFSILQIPLIFEYFIIRRNTYNKDFKISEFE